MQETKRKSNTWCQQASCKKSRQDLNCRRIASCQPPLMLSVRCPSSCVIENLLWPSPSHLTPSGVPCVWLIAWLCRITWTSSHRLVASLFSGWDPSMLVPTGFSAIVPFVVPYYRDHFSRSRVVQLHPKFARAMTNNELPKSTCVALEKWQIERFLPISGGSSKFWISSVAAI